MYWLVFLATALALLPTMVVLLYRVIIVPRKQSLILQSIAQSGMGENKLLIARGGIDSVKADYESLYSYQRLLAPALMLSAIYGTAAMIGICLSLRECATLPCDWLGCFRDRGAWIDPLMSVAGSFTFNMGVMSRRLFLLDITEHLFWSALNRVVFGLGMTLVLAMAFPATPLFVFFFIPFYPRVVLGYFRRKVREQLKTSDHESDELPLELIQGIDIWKEQRLEEEGIESVQNLATCDFFSLSAETHYPLRTLLDWIDQAIVIQRFPKSFPQLREAGIPLSAVELAWQAPDNSEGSTEYADLLAEALKIKPLVAREALNALYQDAYVNAVWNLWQSEKDYK
jgi:hypothetical protein